MAQRSIPRYFVSRSGAEGASRPLKGTLQPAHVVDCFLLGNRHLAEREWIVATDELGNLLALPDEDRGDLSGSIQTELACHEISSPRRKRLIEASQLFLFNLQLLEQPAQSPGLDDPVYLYGTLFGPYPAADGKPPGGIEGQLTVTRVDLLDGLAQAAEYAFRYTAASGDSGEARRCFHLLLPADREEEIERGSGIVLAYPLLPPELLLYDIGNEIVVSQLLYDILSALKEDLAREQIHHPLRSQTLPVPSRSTLEQQLEVQGYEIKGNTAIKKSAPGEGFQGFLASVFGALMNDRLELPPEGEVDDFMELARHTLNALTGFPSSRTVALRRRVKDALPVADRHSHHGRASSSPPIRTPAISSPLPPQQRTQRGVAAPGSGPAPRGGAPAHAVGRRDEPPEWMQDFIAAHHPPGGPAPRLTSTGLIPTAAKQTRKPPEWMQDFDRPTTTKPACPSKPPDPAVDPEWMNDFE
jgi:hypothetical protein